ncbi:hypothetical protein BC628DRAFT_419254 [Trametes gibbosa]|nr:hypothetical protein BC628DRAFT_419254 [Trametes gibbosa]
MEPGPASGSQNTVGKAATKVADSASRNSENTDPFGQIVKELSERHYCVTCKKPCVVLPPRNHHHLTMKVLSHWATEVIAKCATVDKFPQSLIPDLPQPTPVKGQAGEEGSKNPAGDDVTAAASSALPPARTLPSSDPLAAPSLSATAAMAQFMQPSALTAMSAMFGSATPQGHGFLPPYPMTTPSPFPSYPPIPSPMPMFQSFPYPQMTMPMPYAPPFMPYTAGPAQAAPQTPRRSRHRSRESDQHSSRKQDSSPQAASYRYQKSSPAAPPSCRERERSPDETPINVEYPLLKDWLYDEIDLHPNRGGRALNSNCYEWNPYFEQNGLFYLNDLTASWLTPVELHRLIPDMAVGTASRILQWAADDKMKCDHAARKRRCT